MPIAEIELPDGKIAEIEVPNGATQEQIIAFAKSKFTPQKQQEKTISRPEAALTTLTNIPFAPRIKAGIATGVAKVAGVNEPAKDLYQEALNNELDKLSKAREKYPVQSLVSEIASGLALPAAKGLGGAAAMGAGQAIGETRDLKDINDVAGKGAGAALLSAGTYGMLKGVGKAYENFIGAPKVERMTADEVKNLANLAYKKADQEGGVLKGEFINNVIGKAKQLDKKTLIGKSISGNSAINNIVNSLSEFKNKQLNLQSLQELDEALADKIDNFVENGKIKKEGLPLLQLQQYIRNSVDNAGPELIENRAGFESLNQGRKLWAKAAKLRDVERIITRAEMSDNPASAIKTGFRTLFNNPDKLKYFSKEEQKLIKKAAQSGLVEDTLRTLGSRLIPIGSVVAGGGLPSTIAGLASSTASRNLASKAQLIKAEKIAEAIISGKLPMPKQPDSILKSVISQKLGASTIYQQPQQNQNVNS